MLGPRGILERQAPSGVESLCSMILIVLLMRHFCINQVVWTAKVLSEPIKIS